MSSMVNAVQEAEGRESVTLSGQASYRSAYFFTTHDSPSHVNTSASSSFETRLDQHTPYISTRPSNVRDHAGVIGKVIGLDA